LIRNLLAGFALLLPKRVGSDRFVCSFDQIVLLLMFDLLVWAGLDRLHAEAGSKFDLEGMFGWTTYLAVALVGTAIIARVQSRDANTRALLVPGLSVAPFLMALLWLLSDVPLIRDWPKSAVIAALIVLLTTGLRVLRVAFGFVRTRTIWVAVCLIFLSPFVLDAFLLDTSLWVVPEQEDATSNDDLTETEDLFYDQPARIAAAVERVDPSVPGHPSVFFLGFAGVGEQGVFKREALFAQQVFAQRFGSAARSVELINDDRDRESYPLASVSGLGQTVKGLASKMDPQSDVLVLMLTSHGSQDGLAISNGSLPLTQLAPSDLREVLDDAGIKWRIVIVSACYAGVFVDALKSDTTAVITAADADHSSFGCDDSRDLTWFGEAFLRDSLPTESTLEGAFKKAAALIDQRETQEKQIHSNPQLFIGDAMRDKLDAMSSEAHATPAPAPRSRGSTSTRTASATIAPWLKPLAAVRPAQKGNPPRPPVATHVRLPYREDALLLPLRH
jgi:hypothetical protein